jgi:AraC-like DNA-binding protein
LKCSERDLLLKTGIGNREHQMISNRVLEKEPSFREISPGIERLPSGFHLPRHRHLRAYAALVLKGCIEESGYAGRIKAAAGDVLVHPALDCHENRRVSSGATLVRFDWPETETLGGHYQVDDIDVIARAAEKDPTEAAFLLNQALAESKVSPRQENDWPDVLLGQLGRDCAPSLGLWAEMNGLARETVSRGFRAAYGVPPSVLRAELRARKAWLRISSGTDSLSSVAAATGFADQAHMTRWIYRVTGAPPRFWSRLSRERADTTNEIADA